MPSKMYIAIHDEVPDHMVPVLVAHSILGAHEKFKDDEDYRAWHWHSFRKVVLRVNDTQFRRIASHRKLEDRVYLGHENTTMNAEKSCIIICPFRDNEDYPNVIKFAKMWKPKNES